MESGLLYTTHSPDDFRCKHYLIEQMLSHIINYIIILYLNIIT